MKMKNTPSGGGANASKKLLAVFAVLAVAFVVFAAIPAADAADRSSESIDFGTFLKEVEKNKVANNVVYDGQGVQVKWSPSNVCTDNRSDHTSSTDHNGHNEFVQDGNGPSRVTNSSAQYRILIGFEDVEISNVDFVFEPKDFELWLNSGWTKGKVSASDANNAEIQFLNTGTLTLTKCSFDKVVISAYGDATTASIGTTVVEDCTFNDVYNNYAIRDVNATDVTISRCSFTDCSGGVYFAGDNTKGAFTITGNTFSKMDVNASVNKQNTRGLIQFSSSGDYTYVDLVIEDNSYSGNTPVFRQLNDTITSAILDVKAVGNSNRFDAGVSFTSDGGVKDNGTYYVDTTDGNDTNNGTAVDAPFKSMGKAIKSAKAGDTIMVIGILKHTDTNGLQYLTIDKPLNIVGYGDSKVPVTSGINLPKANGTVSFSNFSFDGVSTFGAYDKSLDYKGLDLVIEDCAFTRAGGNCVYIIPEINSLTVRDCSFSTDVSQYQKMYLIWPYQAKTVTIEDNTFDGKGLTRAPIHLGDGHPEGTTAVISGNTIIGFERGVQLAFTNAGASNSVEIDGNEFKDIQLSESTSAESYQFGTVYIHECLVDGTMVVYTDNRLTGTSERAFISENDTIFAEHIVTTFIGNTVDGATVDSISDVSFDLKATYISGDDATVEIPEGQDYVYSDGAHTNVTLKKTDADAGVEMIIIGDVSAAGEVPVRIESVVSPQKPGSIGILITYANLVPGSISITMTLEEMDGMKLTGCKVYYFSSEGNGQIENVVIDGNTVSFITDHCTEYDFVPEYESVRPDFPIIIPPRDDDDPPFIPVIPAVDNAKDDGMETKKVAAVAVASVAAAILAAFIIMDYRKN